MANVKWSKGVFKANIGKDILPGVEPAEILAKN
jgi:hypothetical protein